MGELFGSGGAHLALPLLALPVVFLGHIVVHRVSNRTIFMSFLIAWVAVVCAISLLMAPLALDGAHPYSIADLLVDLGIFSGFAYAYMDFVSFGESSVRTKILDELAGERELTREQLLDRYNARLAIDLRLERLLASEQIAGSDAEGYSLGSARKQIVLARVYLAFRWLLFGSASATSKSLRESGDESDGAAG